VEQFACHICRKKNGRAKMHAAFDKAPDIISIKKAQYRPPIAKDIPLTGIFYPEEVVDNFGALARENALGVKLDAVYGVLLVLDTHYFAFGLGLGGYF
jgi:hypothetical protein